MVEGGRARREVYAAAQARFCAGPLDEVRRFGANRDVLFEVFNEPPGNLRNPDGSYTRLDDLVCGRIREGDRDGAGQMIHEYFMAN